MVQPKNVLFETGAPKIAQLYSDGVDRFPADDWTQVLDLRDDPDQNIVRRVTLFAYRNLRLEDIPDPPIPSEVFVPVCVLEGDGDVVSESDFANSVVAIATIFPADLGPVKILDDYPVRGNVRMIAGTTIKETGLAAGDMDNTVFFGYYTLAGEAGSRAMLDRRPFQIGNNVPESASFAIIAGAGDFTTETDIHQTTPYTDEIAMSFIQAVPADGEIFIFFGDETLTPLLLAAPDQLRYFFVTLRTTDATPVRSFLNDLVVRNTGMITGMGDETLVLGHFTRY